LTGATFQFGVTPFYFVRHGETNDSELGIVQGQEETVLNNEGRLSAWRAASLLSPLNLGSIYSSPLRRAWETAEIISRATAIPVTALPGLMERNWGDYQGKDRNARPLQRDPAGVESTDLFWLRIVAAMKSIIGPMPVLVVAHSGVFRLLCDHAGLSVDARNEVANGVVFKFEPPGQRGLTWRVEAVSG
jgi:probable phosphoglycerate mutase